MRKKLAVLLAAVVLVVVALGAFAMTQFQFPSIQPTTPTSGNQTQPSSSKVEAIFSDGFETATTGVWTTTKGTMQVSSNVRSGKYACKFSVGSNSSGTAGSYVAKSFTDQSVVSAEGYIFIPNLPVMNETDRVYFIIISSEYAPLAYGGIVEYSDGLKWQIMTRNNETFVTQGHGIVEANHYYKVQVIWSKGANGFAKLYVDDLLMGQITGVDTSFFGDANRVSFGIAEKTGVDFGFECMGDDFTLYNGVPK